MLQNNDFCLHPDKLISRSVLKNPIKKVAVIGSASTGKSTVTTALAHYFNAEFVPEFARDYIDKLSRPYVYEDLWEIAKGQMEAEDSRLKKVKTGWLFCDTDLYVLKVWSEHKYGTCDERILRQIAQRRYDFYFLTNIDIAWEPDPQREHSDPKMRQYFFEIYLDIVLHSGTPWQLLSGGKDQRFLKAVNTLKKYFGE